MIPCVELHGRSVGHGSMHGIAWKPYEFGSGYNSKNGLGLGCWRCMKKPNQSRICGKGVGLGLFPSDSLESQSYEIIEIAHIDHTIG